ncbi:histone-lysine N-methyltransferase, H3 lysine-79 specific-like [Mizuhopecten yessoensis]|uniref:Death domain-associated protein 6 n=1 Tax=Mizuhopecten yessoensis TaxID=6573 RepID=A0A210Q7X4_MIZYE|nr:histone-lysine N-methyltransferase, H3 lysine-79 specific-like [Mizuhopecten yessoensis]OWF44789.1 Death domain-associated protein 6 [Mizuhopecten yessoensis]
MTEAAFNAFLNDIQDFIKKTPDLSILIQKRYEECSKSYRTSSKFQEFLQITQAKIDSDNSRVFVHLRDFLNELKTNKAEKNVDKKRKRRESGSDVSEAPSPKSLRDNSTDQDTDCSEAENNSLLCENKVLQKPNRLNKLSLKHQTQNTTLLDKLCEKEKDVLQHPNKNVEAVIENDVLQHPNKTVEAVIENDVLQHPNKTVEAVIENDVLNVQHPNKTVEATGTKTGGSPSKPGPLVNGRPMDQEANQETSDTKNFVNQVSLTLDIDGDICMVVENVDDTQEEMEDVDKLKGNSDGNGDFVTSPKISATVLENDCITIDDDDDDDDEDDLGLKKRTEEKDINDLNELQKQNIPIVSPKILTVEDPDNNKNKNSLKLKDAEKENGKEEICVELTNETSTNEISESVGEDMAKGKIRVEAKQIKNQGAECTETSKKFSEAQQVDEEETDPTESDKGTQSESALAQQSSTDTAVPVSKGSQRQIRRLEKLLEDIRNKIEELKNADLSLDALGEEDSAYIQEDRYQHKFVKVWKKLCELKGAESNTGRPVERRFFYKGTRYPEVNRKLEKFINKHKIFPDFHDVQKVIRDTSKQKKLGLSGPAVDRLAREAFQDIGEKLQERRIRDLRKTSPGHLPDEQGLREDPALRDPELKKRLDDNRKIGKGKLYDVLEKFCKWQEEAPEEKEDEDKKSEDEEEEEEDKEEMESTEKDDVPEMIEILNDDAEDEEEDEVSTSPIKTAADGSSSSVSFLSDDGLFSPSSKTTREVSSPHMSASVQKRLCKDKMAASPLSSPCSPQVSRKESPSISPKLPSSSSSLCSDGSPRPVSPYVVNSPPGSPTGSDTSIHLPSSTNKKSGTLVSIDDYMDCMPVLPKVQIFSNLSNSGTSHFSLSDSNQCTLKISNVQSIAGDSCTGEDREGNSVAPAISHKQRARRHLNWPIENGVDKNTAHVKDEPSNQSDDDNNDGFSEDFDSSNPPSPYPVQRSIMFRNSRKNMSLKPLNKGKMVIDLADEDNMDTLSSSLPRDTVQQVASSIDEDVIIVLSDSD